MLRAFLILCLTFAVLADDDFNGYKVYRLVPTNADQVQTLLTLKKNHQFDFWSFPRSAGKAVDVMVKQENRETFLHDVEAANISCVGLIDSLIDIVNHKWRLQILATHAYEGRISFTQYQSYEQINNYLDKLAEDFPDVVSVEVAGKSHEGRDMKVVKISTNSNASKPIIFIDAGIHAREWAAPAVATYIIHQLVENPENAAMLEKVDWHILPVVNPDGYEYSRETTVFWRKTRSKGKKCYGVDGNRNYAYRWAESGASDEECADNYMGPEAFSEPETRAVSSHISSYKNNTKLYLSLHSFGQYILYPWGFTTDLPDDHEELQELGDAVAKAIESYNGTKFTVGSSTNVLYAAAGGSDDWAKGEAGVELSYTIELQGKGLIGFYPPPEEILPIASEMWEGIKVFHKHVEKKFGLK